MAPLRHAPRARSREREVAPLPARSPLLVPVSNLCEGLAGSDEERAFGVASKAREQLPRSSEGHRARKVSRVLPAKFPLADGRLFLARVRRALRHRGGDVV